MIVVHYKELSLKGRNRPWFIQLLVRNIGDMLRGLPVRSVRSTVGRIEIEIDERAGGAIEPAVREEMTRRLSRVFGIANFSFASRGPHEFQLLANAILRDLSDQEPASFRV